MTAQAIALQDAIARFRVNYPGVEAEAIAEIVRCAVTLVNEDVLAMQNSLFGEVAELGMEVSAARDQIAQLRQGRDRIESPVPAATDELDAIVEHTAAATETILDACEQIDSQSSAMSENAAAALQNQTMRIFEACSFQDITGQRISKVVAALKMVEKRIERIVGMYVPGATLLDGDSLEIEESKDPLLNGPQATHIAMDQAEIDRLLTF